MKLSIATPLLLLSSSSMIAVNALRCPLTKCVAQCEREKDCANMKKPKNAKKMCKEM